MPMGNYPNFEACIKDQLNKHKKEKGFKIENAIKICGFIKKKTELKNNIQVIEKHKIEEVELYE